MWYFKFHRHCSYQRNRISDQNLEQWDWSRVNNPNKSVKAGNWLKSSFTGKCSYSSFLWQLTPCSDFYSVYSPWYYIQSFVCQYWSQYFFSFPDVSYLASLSLSTSLLWTDEKQLFQPVLVGAALPSTLHPNHPSLHLFHLNSFFLLRIVKNISEDTFSVLCLAARALSSFSTSFSLQYTLFDAFNEQCSFPRCTGEIQARPATHSFVCVSPLLSGLRISQFQQCHPIFH